MDNEFGTLRKKAFGGFNPKDVVNCIEKTRNELYEYKTSAEKNIEELKEKIEKLESEKSALEKVNADLAKVNSELIEKAKADEKAAAEITKLENEICELFKKSSSLSRGYVVEQAMNNGWITLDENTPAAAGAYIYR